MREFGNWFSDPIGEEIAGEHEAEVKSDAIKWNEPTVDDDEVCDRIPAGE